MPSYFEHRQYRITSQLDVVASQQLVESVIEESLIREKVFRDNWRTLSAKVRYGEDQLLLKIPRARNGRKWERMLTRFRESDALRTFRHLELMADLGLKAPSPVLAAERRERGVVVDSFVVYRFVEGRIADAKDAGKILAALYVLHAEGYLRGDAQLANFLIVGDEVAFIDFRLKRPWFLPDLQKARELNRFLRSCPAALPLLSADHRASPWFCMASFLEHIRFGLRDLKKKVRLSLKRERHVTRK